MSRSSSSTTPPGCVDLVLLMSSLQRDANRVRITNWQSIALSYTEFVEYFKQAGHLSRHHLIIGASFTYSWMPTMLDFRSARFDLGVAILERARSGEEVTTDDLSELSMIVNNSMVGASKLLHFVAPERFPIWDSRVATYLGATVKCGMAGVSQYQAYAACCRSLAARSEAEGITGAMAAHIGQLITTMRAIELLMYYAALERFTYHALSNAQALTTEVRP